MVESRNPELLLSTERSTLAISRSADQVAESSWKKASFKIALHLVTGAGSGIGRATAELLCADRAPGSRAPTSILEGLDRNRIPHPERPAETATADRVQCGRFKGRRCHDPDLCQLNSGKLNILANVAGVLAIEHTHLTDDAVWDRVLGINLNGTFYTSRAAIPHSVEVG